MPPERIFDALQVIEAVHDNAGYSNPCATASVRVELGRLFNLDGHPRSWPKADRLKYNALPIELRIVIDRREIQNTRALRKLQNDFEHSNRNNWKKEDRKWLCKKALRQGKGFAV